MCYHSSTSVRHVCNELNLPARSSLYSQGFLIRLLIPLDNIIMWHLIVYMCNTLLALQCKVWCRRRSPLPRSSIGSIGLCMRVNLCCIRLLFLQLAIIHQYSQIWTLSPIVPFKHWAFFKKTYDLDLEIALELLWLQVSHITLVQCKVAACWLNVHHYWTSVFINPWNSYNIYLSSL